MHEKPWGAIVTWTYDVAPYLEPGQKVFEDMVYAYQNGAKYILLFDYDKNTTRGIIQQEHLDALKQFWQYAREHPRTPSSPAERVAYVLPADYGYGFRSDKDTLWGLWDADNQSARIWNDSMSLIQQYGSDLDIIYEDTLCLNTSVYTHFIFWNGTALNALLENT